jgi:anti-sigma28 factor (negative regulator of flagellin synthesis)
MSNTNPNQGANGSGTAAKPVRERERANESVRELLSRLSAEGKLGVDSERAEKIAELQKQYANGSYDVDIEELSRKLVNEYLSE